MSLITMLGQVLEESRLEYEKIRAGEFCCTECYGKADNLLAHGDNLAFMKYLMENRGMQGKIKLVYIDPPFFSKAAYDGTISVGTKESGAKSNLKVAAYSDCWETGVTEYLKMLTIRLFAIKELLAEEGCIWVHLDWHVVHYVKLIMDEIFGEKNFVNEVIWTYKSGGSGKKSFAKKHDTLLFYGKSEKYYFNPLTEKSYNRGFKPYRFKGVSEYKDDIGWYTMVNMKDVWQIDMVGRTAGERTGYATQKPEALLERIIMSCSKEGDLCADFFGGSGTLAAVAQKHHRRWITCDMGNFAVANEQLRLLKAEGEFKLLRQKGIELNPGKASVELETEENQNGAAELQITEYKLQAPDKVASEKDVSALKELNHKERLQLISFWSVDYNYEGNCHCPTEMILGAERKENKEVKNMSKGDINIHITDVFGNCVEIKFESDEK